MKYDEVVLAVVWNLLFAFMHMADYDLLLKFMVVGDAGVANLDASVNLRCSVRRTE